MLIMRRHELFKIQLESDCPKPVRWEAWPAIAALAITSDGNGVDVTIPPGPIGMGRFTVKAVAGDGRASRYFYFAVLDGLSVGRPRSEATA